MFNQINRLIQVLMVIFLCGSGIALSSDRSPQGTSTEALRVARGSVGRFKLGRLTVKERSHGRVQVRAEVLYNGAVVARLRVSPQTGGFLAEEERPAVSGESVDLPSLRASVERSLRSVEIGEWTWPTEGGRAWGVPLKYQGRVVGTLKIDVQKGPLARESDDD